MPRSIPPEGVDLAHVRRRLGLIARPNVTIVDPPDDIVVERDVPVPVRDGTVLRANVFRPAGEGPFPTILSIHPYGKDALPKPNRRGGYGVPFQMRMLPQPDRFTISALTGWEAPDPATWTARGYAVVNADLRGWGHSEGTGELLSAQEARDGHDVVEWIAEQPWCTGRVGMLGVSYLAITQWAVAAERPPHLAAICPWEGFTDVYGDFARRGGVLEEGFLRLWSTTLRLQRGSPVTIFAEARRRPLRDDWWAARCRDIERVEVPALVCASFSDHNLHTEGSFEGFRRIGSRERWLYTHRGGKWSTFYSEEAVSAQAGFFDRFLKGEGPGPAWPAPVRVEVRRDARTVTAVRHEADWPPPGTTWSPLHLAPAGRLSPEGPLSPEVADLDLRTGAARFSLAVEDAREVVGPLWCRLFVELHGPADAALFVALRVERAGRVVGFEGSYGFDRALLSFGMRKLSLRRERVADPAPWRLRHPDDATDPVGAGRIVEVGIALGPVAVALEDGDRLRLDVTGRWPFPTNPLLGQFPARYERSPAGRARVHLGPTTPSALWVPNRMVGTGTAP